MRFLGRLSLIAMLGTAALPAMAYIGPGSGISVIGSLLGLLTTVLITVGAIALFPFRKMLKRRSSKQPPENPGGDSHTDPEDASLESVKSEGANTQ
jgi:hypothetical protein